jgi:hypothetical protein
MFTKTAFILAIVIGTASGALAVTKHQSTLPAAASTVSQYHGPGYVYLPGKGIVESCTLPTSYCWQAP